MKHPDRDNPTPTPRDLYLWTAAYDCTLDLHDLGLICPLGTTRTAIRSIILRYLIQVATTERKTASCKPHTPSTE